MFFTSTHTHGLSSSVSAGAGQKQVWSWRMLGSTVLELLLPSCHCTFVEPPQVRQEINRKYQNNYHKRHLTNPANSLSSSFSSYSSTSAAAAAAAVSNTSTVVTGTIFSCQRGKVNFCVQSSSKTLNNIILFLEFTVPSNVLAREMQEGVLRIAFESNNTYYDYNYPSSPLWTMYCNSRKVGFAVRREPKKVELSALKVLNTVAEGAGVVIGEEMNQDAGDRMMYLRASFRRVFGSFGSESFHLIDPRGNIGRELSIFFF